MYQNQFNPYQAYAPRVNNGITWVQGMEGAKAFQMIPSSNAVLLDSENDGVMYIKMTDNIGMQTLRTFNFSEVQEQPKAEYVTKDEFEKVLIDLKGAINGVKQSVQSAKSKPTQNQQ